jgi:hypothetical protein
MGILKGLGKGIDLLDAPARGGDRVRTRPTPCKRREHLKKV